MLNIVFSRVLVCAGLLLCAAPLFCPSDAEVTTALQELAKPELQGTSEQEIARALYLEINHKYSELISEIECHVASNTDAEHLTEYAGMLASFSTEIEDGVANLTLICERVAASEKDLFNVRMLLESLLDTQRRLTIMRADIRQRFTAINTQIAQTIAQDEPKPQQEILDECPEPRPRPSIKPRPASCMPAYVEDTPAQVDFSDDDDDFNPDDFQSFASSDSDFDIQAFLNEEAAAQDPSNSVNIGAQAQQAITAARPMAEDYEFEVIGKTCAHQGATLNCGYHAVCNGHVVAKAIEGMHILNTAITSDTLPELPPPAPVTFENIPLLSTPEILQRKMNFLHTTHEVVNPASAITGFTLAHFAEFNESLTTAAGIPKIYQATTQPAVFFAALEYMQNKEREIIADILELVAFFNASAENKHTLWSFLENGFVVEEGDGSIQTHFPDQPQLIPNTPFSTDTLKNAYLFWRAMATRGEYETFTNALHAFKVGKTLVMPWLDHSGSHAGCGHWTCKVFIPEKHNGAVQPNFVKIINIDSCDATAQHAHIDDNVKRFVFDLLHLELPTPADLHAIAELFNPRNIFAERYLLEGPAEATPVTPLVAAQ